MIHVLIADDHTLFAETLALGINAVPDLNVTQTVHSGRDVLDVVAETTPDVLVMDLEMPDLTGLDVLRSPITLPPTIIVTMHADAEQSATCFEAGAHGFLPKSTPLADLAAAIRAVHSGAFLNDPVTLSEDFVGALSGQTCPRRRGAHGSRTATSQHHGRGSDVHSRPRRAPVYLRKDCEEPPREHL